MALIKCAECGKEISDKATTCIHCGCPIEKELICNECGNKLNKNDKVCKCCGCPIKSKSKEENSSTSIFTKIWLIICIILCFLISGINFFNIFNIYIQQIVIGNLNTNIMGILALMLGVSYILLLKKTNKKNFAMLVAINILVFVYNMFSFQILINLLYILCAITNTLITFIVIRKSINSTNFDIKENIPVLVIFIILLGLILIFPKSDSDNSNDYYEEDIELTENELKVYNTLVDIYFDRAYNPQAIRVVSGNTLFGFKISGTNQVGATITNCISLMPANYRDEDTCSSVHDDVSKDTEWYIDVYKINQKLKEYWENRGM
ncbi:MAG: zinc ribbon domain-containing protein [Bacilli bacterium]